MSDPDERSPRPRGTGGPEQYSQGISEVSGRAVQAREVHGGVHFHDTSPAHAPAPGNCPPTSTGS